MAEPMRAAHTTRSNGAGAPGRRPTQGSSRCPALMLGGITLGALGFSIIGIAWNGAAELDFVQGQFPFFISGGLTGIGLIVVGAALMVLDTMRRDAQARSEEIDELTATVRALRRHLSPPDPYDPEVAGVFRPRPRGVGNGRHADETAELPPAGGAHSRGSR